MKELSLNSIVEVDITEYGREILRKKDEEVERDLKDLPMAIEHVRGYYSSRVDENGVGKFALWELMAFFGQEMLLGNMNLPIKDAKIRVLEEDIKEVQGNFTK